MPDYPNPVNGLQLYRYVYEDWYCASCAKVNEKPVSFSTYQRIVPRNEARELYGYLLDGRKP